MGLAIGCKHSQRRVNLSGIAQGKPLIQLAPPVWRQRSGPGKGLRGCDEPGFGFELASFGQPMGSVRYKWGRNVQADTFQGRACPA